MRMYRYWGRLFGSRIGAGMGVVLLLVVVGGLVGLGGGEDEEILERIGE